MTIPLIIWGVWSAGKRPINALPDVTNNQVQMEGCKVSERW